MVGLSDESKKALSKLLETMDANDVVMMFIKHTGAQYEPEFFRLLLSHADVNIRDPIAFIESTGEVFWASDYDEVVAEMCGDYYDDIDESARKSFKSRHEGYRENSNMKFNDMVKLRRYDIKKDYDDDYDDFVSNLPDRIEQNGYDMYYHNSDSEFITYLNNGKCNIELTIFPDNPPDNGYFTIEEYDVSTMSWELVAEDFYDNTDDLLNKIKEKLNDMPEGS